MIYRIILKRKDNNYEEPVGETFDKEQAYSLRDYYNEQEDNKAIYYLVKSFSVPKAKARAWGGV